MAAKYKRWILLINWVAVASWLLSLAGIVMWYGLFDADYLMAAIYRWGAIAVVIGLVVHTVVALVGNKKTA